MNELQGKVAILTGGSRGLGLAIGDALVREGVAVALAARSVDELETARSRLEAAGGRVVAISTDVADAEQRRRLVRRTAEQLGPIDILINNAGIERVGDFTTMPESVIAQMIAVNLHAPMALVREVLPAMLARGAGHVVNVASLAGKGGPAFNEPYAATKAGLVGFTESLRASYVGRGVGFSAVCPGFVAAEGMHARMVEAGHATPRAAGAVQPEDVAAAVVRAIRRDLAEVLVNKRPVRALLMVAVLFPQLREPIMRRMGVTEFFKRAAGLSGDARA